MQYVISASDGTAQLDLPGRFGYTGVMEPNRDPLYPLSEETVALFQCELEQATKLRDYYIERVDELSNHLVKSGEARKALNASTKTLNTGKMYRITFTKPGGRITLESQMKLIAINESKLSGRTLVFSARPRFGTQEVPESMIEKIELVPPDAYVYVNHDRRKGEPKDTWTYSS